MIGLEEKILNRRLSDLYEMEIEDELILWEQSVEAIKNVERISLEKSAYFSNLLRNESDADSYLTSMSYYFFTGRKGLWIYKNGESFIPFCWHPNVPDQVLVFPQRGRSCPGLLDEFLSKVPMPPAGISLVRVKESIDAVPSIKAIGSLGSVVLSPVVEPVLDWKYPVRVLSTKTVSAMNGPEFRYIRNRVKQIERADGKIAAMKDVPVLFLEEFIRRWAGSNTEFYTEEDEMFSLYQKIISFRDKAELGVDGFVVFINGEIEALTMWDTSNAGTPIANRFVNLCDTTYGGLADFCTVSLARKLGAQGIEYLNIGGAETESLDQFKRKFQPAYSLKLHSVEVKTKTTNGLSFRPYSSLNAEAASYA